MNILKNDKIENYLKYFKKIRIADNSIIAYEFNRKENEYFYQFLSSLLQRNYKSKEKIIKKYLCYNIDIGKAWILLDIIRINNLKA